MALDPTQKWGKDGELQVQVGTLFAGFGLSALTTNGNIGKAYLKAVVGMALITLLCGLITTLWTKVAGGAKPRVKFKAPEFSAGWLSAIPIVGWLSTLGIIVTVIIILVVE